MDDESNKIDMSSKVVVIFGTFDGIHDGHRRFIGGAKKQGEKLVAIITRDYIVKKLKNKISNYKETQRLNMVFKLDEIDSAFLGDKKQGSYNILKKINPDIIYLGYDQKKLYKDISKRIKNKSLPNFKLVFGKPYKPELFHSSILNKF